MSADPIREALWEAAMAAVAVDNAQGYHPSAAAWGKSVAAATISAFLRALPDESGVNIAAPDTRDDWFGCDELAAIIEHAANGKT